MNKLTEWLIKDLIDEGVELPIKVGDTVLMGRFKNKRVKIKSINFNEKGDLLINNRPALKFRVVSSQTTEAARIPRKKGQHRGSSSHSDLYTDENPKGTIKGLKFATVKDAQASVSKIKGSGKKHAHKIQAAVAMEQRAKEMGKKSAAAVYRKFINQMKKKTKAKNEVGLGSTKKVVGSNVYTFGPDWIPTSLAQRKKMKRLHNKLNKSIREDVNYLVNEFDCGCQELYEIEKINEKWSAKYKKSINCNNPKGFSQRAHCQGRKKNEEFGAPAGVIPSPSRKMVKKMKKKGNTSVPYGSGYEKIEERFAVRGNKVEKFITGKNLTHKGKKYKEIDFELVKVDNPKKLVTLRILAPKKLFGQEVPVRFQTLRRGPFLKTDTSKVREGLPTKTTDKFKKLKNKPETDAGKDFSVHHGYSMSAPMGSLSEPDTYDWDDDDREIGGTQKEKDKRKKGYEPVKEDRTKIKKVVGIYGGRFQPFGPHHKKTYDWLKSRVDDAYITTSDIKKPPRHPMNFNEKVRHMVKMGIPKNRIVKEKSPYIAKNVLKKYDEKTTAVIYIFGKKDAGRLSGGKYFKDYDKNRGNILGYGEHGYILTAPHVSIKVGGKEVSGTVMRDLLGSPENEKGREKLFKQAFGYFDKGIYNMMTNKFKKLYEFYQQDSVKEIIKEVSALGATITAGDLDDEGLYDFFNSFADYKRVSPKHAQILGWDVIDDIIDFENATDPGLDYSTSTVDRISTVTYGRTINQNTKNTDSVDNPFPKYKQHMNQMIDKLGWEIVKFFGEKEIKAKKIKDSDTHDMGTATAGSGNTNKPATPDKLKKIQENFQRDVGLLIEGGAYGHMSHPFDDNNLTFSDLKQIIINGIGGKLDREDGVTEKLDGQNLMVSWVDGKLKAARNKGHLKNRGKTAPTTSGVKSMFSGRGDIQKAFVGAMKDLEKAIGKLSDKQKEKVFGNGTKWMNLEVMYPATANVVDYDVAEIVFHGTIEYDDSGRAVGQPKDSARMLAGMIKQVNQSVQKMFRIGKPNFLQVPKSQNFGKLKGKFLQQINKLQSTYSLKDTDKLGEYHQAYWREYVFNASKQFKVSLKPNQFVSLVNRWAYFDKSYKIADIKKDYKDSPKFLDWILSTDKNDVQKIFKDNIKPFEVLFFSVGAEILKNISGYMAASPNKTVQKMRKEVIQALRDLKSGGKVDKLKKLKIQIEKLEAIGGLDAIVPSEGVVFKYKGKTYKFTGAFAPINQILGSLKFG